MTRTKAILAALTLGACGGLPQSAARAEYITYIYQSRTDVIAVGSGSINTTALQFAARDQFSLPRIHPSSVGFLAMGDIRYGIDTAYYGLSGPMSFGTGGWTNAPFNTATGLLVFLVTPQTIPGGLLAGQVGVPNNYVSGTQLGTSTATWKNTTLDALGVTIGTYTWTWGSGATADSYTLYVGQAPSSAVPEPGTLALLAAPLAVVSFRRRRTSGGG